MNGITKLFRMGLAAWSVALLPWFGPAQQTDPGDGAVRLRITQVDTSQFPKITAYISATDAAGEPVGIGPDRITLQENGAAMIVDSVSGEGEIGPLTTLLIMDISGSMNEAGKLDAAKAAAGAYVEQMRPGDQAGLLAFNTEIAYVQSITVDRPVLIAAINNLQAKNDTAVYDALVKGVDILGNVEGRKAIIALTDGLDNRSAHTGDNVIEQIGPSGLSISTIGLGDPSQLGVSNAGLDEKSLQRLAERAGGVYGYANDPESLRGLYEKYGRTLQSEYVITYTSPSTLRDGVDRALSVSFAEAGQQAIADQVEYNPGGLVPEVPQVSWPLFVAALAGLLVLLLAPALVSLGAQTVGRLLPFKGKPQKKSSRIRLHDQPEPRIRLR